MTSAKPEIGFVGLGAMGFGMATNLVKHGYPIKGYDVFPVSVERFKAAGGIPATSLRDSADGKQYYICMVASAPQVQDVLFNSETGILDGKFHSSLYRVDLFFSSIALTR
jgi:3-hydroxyisobutyrate dehydrogenase